jgi:hypothetical protein
MLDRPPERPRGMLGYIVLRHSNGVTDSCQVGLPVPTAESYLSY